ncbi:MAG: hypothetical protein ABSD45_23630, partial [Terriglobia bacterium]
TASQSACGDDIQSQKSPAAMMMTHSPRPACVQISTFLRDCRHLIEVQQSLSLIQQNLLADHP